MPEQAQIPLQQATASVDASFCDFKTVQDWLDFFVENIVANATSFFDAIDSGIIFSPTAPTGNDFGKLWVKTTGGGVSDPRGVGIVIDGSYVIIPIPQDAVPPVGVPPGGIIMWGSATAPEGWSIFPGTPPVGTSYIVRN